MPQSEFEQNPGFFKDLVHFILHNKKWWLIPIVVVFILLSTLLVLSSTSVAPFIYSLF